MKLELKHLVPYLPYKLKCKVTDLKKITIAEMHSVYSDGSCTFHNLVESQKGFSKIKPILRPMSDLANDNETIYEINLFLEPNGLEINNWFLLKNSIDNVAISYEEIQNLLIILFKKHYDIFNLISEKLAVSVHDVG